MEQGDVAASYARLSPPHLHLHLHLTVLFRFGFQNFKQNVLGDEFCCSARVSSGSEANPVKAAAKSLLRAICGI